MHLGLLAVWAAAVVAQAPPSWRLEVVDCEDNVAPRSTLVDAVSLELSATPDDASSRVVVHVRWPCEPPLVANVEVRDAGPGVRATYQVDLTATPDHLRDRVVALVVREAVWSAARLEVSTTSPPPTAPSFSLEASLTGRLFLLDRPTWLWGGAGLWAWRWVRAGVSVQGAHAEVTYAHVDGVVVALGVGAMPVRWASGRLGVEAGAWAEGGVATTWTTSKLIGFQGTQSVTPWGGASLRAVASWALGHTLVGTASLDVGYDVGVRVLVLAEPALVLGGPFVGVRLGAQW